MFILLELAHSTLEYRGAIHENLSAIGEFLKRTARGIGMMTRIFYDAIRTSFWRGTNVFMGAPTIKEQIPKNLRQIWSIFVSLEAAQNASY
jgi:hypothetical protein